VSADTVAVLFALGAAICWGFSSVYVRLAQQYLPTSFGTLISLITGIAVAGAVVLIFDPGAIDHLTLRDALVYAIIGIFNFPFGRYMNYLSIRYLGVGPSAAALASTPIFASPLAIVFFGETAGIANVIGTGLVLGGLYLTLFAGSARQEAGK